MAASQEMMVRINSLAKLEQFQDRVVAFNTKSKELSPKNPFFLKDTFGYICARNIGSSFFGMFRLVQKRSKITRLFQNLLKIDEIAKTIKEDKTDFEFDHLYQRIGMSD